MFVHGGITEDDRYLNDSYIFNLSPPYKWSKCNVNTSLSVPTLAFHTCCLVLPSELLDNNKLNIYKINEIDKISSKVVKLNLDAS